MAQAYDCALEHTRSPGRASHSRDLLRAFGAALAAATGDTANQPCDHCDDQQHDADPQEKVHGLHEAAYQREDDCDDDNCDKYAVHALKLLPNRSTEYPLDPGDSRMVAKPRLACAPRATAYR